MIGPVGPETAAPPEVSSYPAGSDWPPGLPNGARVILAPLCGITDAVYRRICLQHGAEMAVTEMISSEALTRGKQDGAHSLRGLDMSEGPLSLQIFGADPDRMAETAARLSQLHPAYIDMNFGCPVRKVVNQNGGSAVLKDLDLLGRICREVVRRSSVPVSAKVRAGWDKPSGGKIRDIARTVEDVGVSMLAVHARTKTQGFDERADWDLIAEAKRAVSIPVVGNGDIRAAEDVVHMYRHTACDAVMIGRAAIGNPWIFREVAARLDGRAYRPPTAEERIGVLLEQVRAAAALYGEPAGVVGTRRQMAAYVKNLPGARELRGRIMGVATVGQLEDLLGQYSRERSA